MFKGNTVTLLTDMPMAEKQTLENQISSPASTPNNSLKKD